MCPFLKEFVKRKRFSPGGSVTGAPGEVMNSSGCVGRAEPCVLLVVSVSGLVSVVVATGSCNRSFQTAIAPNSFLRKVPPTIIVSSSARFCDPADADVSGANSSPPGPLQPERRAAGLGRCWPRPPHPRSEPSWPQREGSRVARGQLRSNNRAEARSLITPLCFVRFDGRLVAATIPLTWAEGRALLRSNPSAVPGANTEWGGTRPPSAIRDWHQGAKPPGLRPPAAARRHPCQHSCFSLSSAPVPATARHSA